MTSILVPTRRRVRAFATSFALAFLLTTAPASLVRAGTPVILPPTVDGWLLSGALSMDPVFVPGELLVQFQSGTAKNDRARAVRDEQADLASDVTPDGLVKVRVRGGDTVDGALARFRNRGDVVYAVPNLRAQAFALPNDSLITDPDFDWAWNLRIIHAYDAYDIRRGDPRVVVAILDTGVAYEDNDVPSYERVRLWPTTQRYKPSVELPGPFVAGWDFVHDDPNADDDDGHGTNVATILAGQPNNRAGSAGVAPGVTIMPIKVIDWQRDSDMSWITAGIRFAADHGAHIMNLSLGFPPLDTFRFRGYTENEIRDFFRPLREAVNHAQGRGVILVAASGNYGASEVSLPAGYPGVIAVGASDPDGRLASYSSWGTKQDFIAPGGDFGDLNHDRLQDAVFVYSIKPFRSEGSLAKPDSFGVFPFFGTSGAAPHVAGAIALLMSGGMRAQGAMTNVLAQTSIRPPEFGPTGINVLYGAGLIQLDAALRAAKGKFAVADAVETPISLPGISMRLQSGNPARGGAGISYRVTTPGHVRVRVFDAAGRLVRVVEERDAARGEYNARWDGRDASGATAAAGIYFIRVEGPDGAAARKFAFLR